MASALTTPVYGAALTTDNRWALRRRSFSFPLAQLTQALCTSRTLFVTDDAERVVQIVIRVDGTAASQGTIQFRIAASGTAISAGTAIVVDDTAGGTTAAAEALSGFTSVTNKQLTLTATQTSLDIPAGGALGFVIGTADANNLSHLTITVVTRIKGVTNDAGGMNYTQSNLNTL